VELPKFKETFLPILQLLENGETIKGRELIRLVEEKYYSKLPSESSHLTGLNLLI
jgi:restriction system protein